MYAYKDAEWTLVTTKDSKKVSATKSASVLDTQHQMAGKTQDQF